MVMQPVNLEAVDKEGRTPLSRAAVLASEQGTKESMQSGARVDARDDNGRMPLHHAAANGFTGVVIYLLDQTPEDWALQKLSVEKHNCAPAPFAEIFRLVG